MENNRVIKSKNNTKRYSKLRKHVINEHKFHLYSSKHMKIPTKDDTNPP